MQTLLEAQERGWCIVIAFVVMPDHYHIVIEPVGGRTLPSILGTLNELAAKRINDCLGRRGSLWQEGFHDHAVRTSDDFAEILRYIHMNPVRAGLCSSPEEWAYSTANARYEWLIEKSVEG